jgi:spore maturation protein CgeB
MKLVVFGLSVSSSWGNGHATLWRGLIRALGEAGHEVVFFEWDVPYYARHRDGNRLPHCRVELYTDWSAVSQRARRELADCDVAMVTSYCPDGAPASELVLASRAPLRVFYDLDTPVTLDRLARGDAVDYLPPAGLGAFDLVLSSTGGGALDELKRRLGARRVAPLYGSVDPTVHRPAAPEPRFASHLSYLGAWAADRQAALDALFLEPARRLADKRFLLAGAQYPHELVWPDNVHRFDHVPPGEHAAFYCSSPLTLSVTRAPMVALGHCPSGRLFEAAACGVPVLSDAWEGLDGLFEPDREILIARNADEAMAHLQRSPEELHRIGEAARARTLAQHTAAHRAEQLIVILEGGMANVNENANATAAE